MKTPQRAIFKEGSNKFTFLEFKLKPNATAQNLVSALRPMLNEKSPVNIVVAFGLDTWTKLQPHWKPESLESFKTLTGVENYQMPSTQNDLFFWLHSTEVDDNFDAALKITNALSATAKLKLDQAGFTYHDSRDLIGFVDGTANPKPDARHEVALIPDGELGEGGSIVFTQKWVHNLNKFNAMPVPEQEGVVGRTKIKDVELEGDAMPHNSHVSRTDVKVNDEGMKIYRRSAPFGNSQENGLLFLAFAKNTQRIQVQLESMVGATDDKVYDRLMEFSTPVTGSYWFAPSEDDLNEIFN